MTALLSPLRSPLQPALRGPLQARVGGAPSLDAQIAAIYAAGRLGPWFDPSDLATMFTTRAGMTNVGTPGNGTAHFVGRILDKSGGGYHALAANDTTARPQLSARVNLFERTEDFSNAYWSKSAVTATADKITETATTAVHHITRSGVALSASTSYDVTVKLKAAERSFAIVYVGTVGVGQYFDLTNGSVGSTFIGAPTSATISALPDNWWQIKLVFASGVNTSCDVRVYVSTGNGISNYAGDGVSGIFAKEIDIRPTNIHAAGSIPAYQRVTSAEDYDSVGFPYRLIPNGTGQALQTSTITPGTDSVTVGVGARVNSNVVEHLLEFGSNSNAVNGSWSIYRTIISTLPRWGALSRGTLAAASSGDNTAPNTSNLLFKSRIGLDALTLGRNGGEILSSIEDQGTGDYAAQALNLFARNGASSWFGGQYFGSITLFGPQLSAGELATVEAWINSKTKAY